MSHHHQAVTPKTRPQFHHRPVHLHLPRRQTVRHHPHRTVSRVVNAHRSFTMWPNSCNTSQRAQEKWEPQKRRLKVSQSCVWVDLNVKHTKWPFTPKRMFIYVPVFVCNYDRLTAVFVCRIRATIFRAGAAYVRSVFFTINRVIYACLYLNAM